MKQSEEWGDPSKCEGAEGCQYCHTRTEQQFHPEVCPFNRKGNTIISYVLHMSYYVVPFSQIYKSTKCNDMQQCGSCPRGPFCAFAHVDSKFPCVFVCTHFRTRSVPNFSRRHLVFFLTPPESFVPEESSFPTPNSPPPPRLPDPLSAQEAPSPSRLRMVPGSACASVSDPFSQSAGAYAAEQGLLGNILSQCEDLSGGAEPLSPWAAGEGGYCRAPGFEREDQVRKHREGGSFGLMEA